MHLRTKFHSPGSSGPLVIAVKLRDKWIFSHGRHVVILHSAKNGHNKSWILIEDILTTHHFRILY